MSIFYFIFVFLLVVNIHEFGHFLFAKLFGVRVEEYGFGWPPRLVSKLVGKTRYSLNLLLAGGFVKLFGKDIEEKDALTAKDSFQTKSFYQRTLIILGGIIFNLLLAFVIFYFLFLTGFPRMSGYDSRNVYIHHLGKGSPAEQAGLLVGDRILAVGEEVVNDFTKLKDIVGHYAGQRVGVRVNRAGEELTLFVTPDPLLGVGVSGMPLEKGTVFSSFGLAFRETGATFKDIASVFYRLLTGRREGIELSGPIGIARYSGRSAKMGAVYFWQFVASLSVNLAVLNLLPFPALDGGWMTIVSLEALRRKRFSAKAVNLLNSAGFAVLIALLVFVTVRDVLGRF